MKSNDNTSISLQKHRNQMFLTLAFALCCLVVGTASDSSRPTPMTGQKRHLRPNNGNGSGSSSGTGNRPPTCASTQKYDVVVVGAGWAGIKTAELLTAYMSYNPDFKFTVLEKNLNWELIGRAISARYLMGGRKNPVAGLLSEQYNGDMTAIDQHKKDVKVVSVYNGTKADYFDSFGTRVTDNPETEVALTTFGYAYECLRAEAEALFDAAPGDKDKSMRDVLISPKCGWMQPDSSSIERSIEYASIDYEFSSTPDIMGMFNFPADRPNKDFADDTTPSNDWFLTAPLLEKTFANSASIGAWYVKNRSLEDFISNATGVAKIYWDNDDLSRYPVMIKTETETKSELSPCYDILANRVIFTPSIGVLEHRGDCLHATGSNGPEGCDPSSHSLPLFDPVLPFHKMESIRRVFIDQNRLNPDPLQRYPAKRAGMADYVEVRFQFKEAFWSTSSAKDYLIFEDEKGCRMWQNHNENFYKNSRALSCTINSDKLDEIADADTKVIDPDRIKILYKHSLGLLQGAPLSDDCIEINKYTWYPGNTTEMDLKGKPCGYSYFPSWTENQIKNDYDDWYGSYVTWNVGPNSLNALDQDFKDYTAPLTSNGENRVYISGTGICDRHQGWVQGAYYAAIKVTKQMLGDIDPSYDTTDLEKWDHYCDLGPLNTTSGIREY